jgi:hypothetical protein
MRTVAYISRACRALDTYELGDLLDDARRFNAEHGLTGVLLHDHGMFLQLIEGDAPAIDEAMRRIRRSKKHEDLIVVFDETITTRLFPAWAMGWPGSATGQAAARAVVAAATPQGSTPGQQDMLGVVRQFLIDGEPPAAPQPSAQRELSSGAA